MLRDQTPRWVGHMLRDEFGVEPTQAKVLVDEWVKTGLLVEREYTYSRKRPQGGAEEKTSQSLFVVEERRTDKPPFDHSDLEDEADQGGCIGFDVDLGED